MITKHECLAAFIGGSTGFCSCPAHRARKRLEGKQHLLGRPDNVTSARPGISCRRNKSLSMHRPGMNCGNCHFIYQMLLPSSSQQLRSVEVHVHFHRGIMWSLARACHNGPFCLMYIFFLCAPVQRTTYSRRTKRLRTTAQLLKINTVYGATQGVENWPDS